MYLRDGENDGTHPWPIYAFAGATAEGVVGARKGGSFAMAGGRRERRVPVT
jgi:hypothetical protein